MLKLISWNVNGLRACCGKGFEETFNRLDADFFCLQETKMQAGQLDLQFMGYQSYWNYADKKGYSGTAIYTRHQPLSVTYGIGVDEHDHEGRVITLEMEQFYLITVYVPNSQDGLRRLDYRMKWEDDFLAYLKKLEEKKPVVVCGDLNVAHQEIDLKNPKANRRNAGFTDEVYPLARCRLHRYFPSFLSRPEGHIFVVVLSFQGARKECGVAYRLFRDIIVARCQIGGCQDSHRCVGFRPLSGRVAA